MDLRVLVYGGLFMLQGQIQCHALPHNFAYMVRVVLIGSTYLRSQFGCSSF